MKRHLLFLFCFFLSLTAARATVYYVDGARTHNTGNGLSWQFAKKDIQAAINAAAAGDEIWVKAGTYLPTEDPNGGTSQRDKTFYLTSKDLRLYGGFSGNETLLSQRAPATNLTTLSGDLDGSGGTDDAYHVVITNGRTTACVVDGFTITGGRADGGSVFAGLNQNRGGGMYNNSSSPTVTNCIFTANSANLWGGGMFNANSSSPAVSNCVFSANVGSGMANYQSSPAVSSCTFSNNTATNGGGGMYNDVSSPTVSNCTFSANTTSTYGGGMYNYQSNTTVTNCTFSSNTASYSGGGMANQGSNPTVSGCVFTANAATDVNTYGEGGGMYNFSYSNPTVGNCAFSANTAGNFGGGLANYSSDATITDCVFSINTARYGGGGISSKSLGSIQTTITISSSTFSANTATEASAVGGGIVLGAYNGGTITNSIFYGNTTPNNANWANRRNIFKSGPNKSLTVSYTLIGDYSAAAMNEYSASNILVADPAFVDATSPAGGDGVWRTADDGLRIGCTSPARNAGTGTTPTTDISGNPRVGALDLGAYEYQGTGCPTLIYVDGSRPNNSGSGAAWASAKKDIQVAINEVAAGGEIWVKAGTYLPTLDPNGGTSQRDKTFYLTTKDVKLYGGFSGNETLLSQRNPTTNVTTLSGDLDGSAGTNDAYHVLLTIACTSACVIDGFTITGGRANGGTTFAVSNPSANIDQSKGGGMYNEFSSKPTVSNCVFSANTAQDGGGVYNISVSDIVMNSCTFSANTASSQGGGLYYATSGGGSITNAVLYGNTGGPANRQNIYKDGTSTALSVSYALIGDYSAAATNNYTSGAGIIGGNPLFVNSGNPAGADGVFRTADDGLAVRCVSPVRNVGTGTTPATDIVGSNRFGTIDLGAYEYQGTGCPTRMYVDAGKADNAGVGTSWATAKKDVQTALTDLVAGGEIWAKAGTYLPTEDPNGNASPTDPRDKAFYLTTKDVKLYGGFSGNETLLSQRNPATNVTILSGDLDGAGGTSGAYHVLVTIGRSNACVVDGFTISGGRANGNSTGFNVTAASTSIYRFLGAGMCNKGSSPTVNACVFSSNTTSDFGGGMANTDNSNPIVSSCTFSGNTSYDGGGMYNSYGSSPAVSFCTFSSNTASNSGGGMHNYQSSNPILNTCTFSANTAKSGGGIYNSRTSNPSVNASTFTGNNATLYGGGMCNSNSSHPVVSTSTFSANSATLYGGGMYNSDTSKPMVRACIFSGNTSNNNGGGMYNEDGSRPVVKACTFSSNSAINYGGGMYNKYVSAFIVDSCIFLTNSAKQGGGIYNDYSGVAMTACAFSANTAVDGGGVYNNVCNLLVEACVFSANTASSNGGGMYVDYCNIPVNSCTFTGNTAGSRGAGLYYAYFPINGGNTITNCILTNNTGGYVNQQNIHNNSSRSGLTVSYSVVGDYSTTVSNNQYTSGAGIIAADPLFANASSPAGADGRFGTADDGLQLQSCSPALNIGTGTTPTADISGNNRVGAIDLGAYEYQSLPSATLAADSLTTDTRSPQGGSAVSFGSCGALIARLTPSGASPVSGSITAAVYVQDTTPVVGQTPYVRRHYDLSPATNPNTATAEVTLYFTQGDFDAYNAVRGTLPSLPVDSTDAGNYKNNVRITQEHGTSASGLPNSYTGWAGSGPAKVLFIPSSVSWNTGLSRWEVTFPVVGFSGFFLHTTALPTPLPVKLLTFSARKVSATQNQVEWMTAKEEPGAVFHIERSGDGKTFESIGGIPCQGLDEGSQYRFDDHAPLPNANYYRLKIVEVDGTEIYSNTVLLKGEVSAEGSLTVAPNPASDHLKITCTDSGLLGSRAVVLDAKGRVVLEFRLDAETDVTVQAWPSGVYFLHAAKGNAVRIIKQ